MREERRISEGLELDRKVGDADPGPRVRPAKAAAIATRTSLLHAAYHDMRRRGYQGAGIGDILSQTGLTKGAFYHHFESKRDLGIAVLDDCVALDLARWWINPVIDSEDPLFAIRSAVESRLLQADEGDLIDGSPFATLTADMAPLDDAFRARLDGLYRSWRKALSRALRRGQQTGMVRADVDADAVAALIVAAIEGVFLQIKAAPHADSGNAALSGLAGYLDSLRP